MINKIVVTVSIGLLIVACGGGSGGSGSANDEPAATEKFPIAKALEKIYTEGYNETLYYSEGQTNYIIQVNNTPKPDTKFQGESVSSSEITSIFKIDGAVVNNSVTNQYFKSNPVEYVGSVNSNGQVEVVSQSSPLPNTASVGQSGAFYVSDEYTDDRLSMKDATVTATWSLEAINSNAAYLCINSDIDYAVASEPDITTSECYKIDKAGNISGAKATLFVPGSGQATFLSK